MTAKSDRIPATERREQILEAATRVFGDRGYHGATTDAVAREAGISQPYVLRLFGSKEQLFIDVLERTSDRVYGVLDAAILDEEGGKELFPRIGGAYVDLVKNDRGLLLSMMQGFLLGQDRAIGPVARRCFMRLYGRMRVVMTGEEAMRFMAQGMLINTMLGSQLAIQGDGDKDVDELLACTFGDELGHVLEKLNS